MRESKAWKCSQDLLAALLVISVAATATSNAYAASVFGVQPRLGAPHAKPAVAVRFVSPDPMDPTVPGVGTNRYAYSANDPVNKADPSGHVWGLAAGFIGGLLGAFFGGTKEANAPTKDNVVTNTSDAQVLANTVTGAVAGAGATRAAGAITRSVLSEKGKKDQDGDQSVDPDPEQRQEPADEATSSPPKDKAAAGVSTDGKVYSRTVKVNGVTYRVKATQTFEGKNVILRDLEINRVGESVAARAFRI